MVTIEVRGYNVTVLPGYDDALIREQLEALLSNHEYNVKTDWEEYRKVGNKWRKTKTS